MAKTQGLRGLFVIDLERRTSRLAGLAASSDESWMNQIARSPTDCDEGSLSGYRIPIHDRDSSFIRAFDPALVSAAVHPVEPPARGSNLDACAD